MVADSTHPPDNHCYWARPALLLAGRNPTRLNVEFTRDALADLLLAGVRVVINLTQEYEIPSYDSLLMEQAVELGVTAEHHRIPIRDMGVCSREVMVRILDQIDAAHAAGKPVFVHCYAGIGRTGLVVGCHFVRHGMSGEEALAEIAMRRRNVSTAWMRSPESDEQVAMLLAWRAGM